MTELKEVRRSKIEFFEVVTQRFVDGNYVDEEYTYEAVGEFGVIDSCDTISELFQSLMTER